MCHVYIHANIYIDLQYVLLRFDIIYGKHTVQCHMSVIHGYKYSVLSTGLDYEPICATIIDLLHLCVEQKKSFFALERI